MKGVGRGLSGQKFAFEGAQISIGILDICTKKLIYSGSSVDTLRPKTLKAHYSEESLYTLVAPVFSSGCKQIDRIGFAGKTCFE